MSVALPPLPSFIRASAYDAGNFSMRRACRTVWSEDDYDAAADALDELVSTCYGAGIEGKCRFSVAEALERNGYLTIGMSVKEMRELVESSMYPDPEAVAA